VVFGRLSVVMGGLGKIHGSFLVVFRSFFRHRPSLPGLELNRPLPEFRNGTKHLKQRTGDGALIRATLDGAPTRGPQRKPSLPRERARCHEGRDRVL
jgi:hypothetical protein